MIISENKKFVFVHITKTGGTSISISLEPCLQYNDIILGGSKYGEKINLAYKNKFGLHKHSLAREIRQVIGQKKWESFFTFSLVRHPYNRAVSEYSYLEKLLVRFFGVGIVHNADCNFSLSLKSHLRYRLEQIKGNRRPSQKLWLLKWPAAQAYLSTHSFSEYIRHPFVTERNNSFVPQWNWLSDSQGDTSIVEHLLHLENLSQEWSSLCTNLAIQEPLSHANKSQSRNKPTLTLDDRNYLYERFKVDFDKLDYEP